MKYKKKILSVLLAAVALTGYAQDSDHIAISGLSLKMLGTPSVCRSI